MKLQRSIVGLAFGALLLLCMAPIRHAYALIPPPGPQSGAVGVEGKIPSPPPSQAATIVAPANGQTFTATPITVSGFCPKDTLVKIFDNNIFVGSTTCVNSSYSLQIALFSGRNELVARVFDALDQEGPLSNTITVTFTDARFAIFGTQVTLTSQYARRGANPGQTLTWPVVLSGGLGPYALSIDWGDGKSADLFSVSFPGVVNLSHIYATAGTYNVIIRATDHNGTTAFLQVVAVINGSAGTQNSTQNSGQTKVVTKVMWLPTAASLVLAPASFWLGRRYELAALRKRIEREYR